MSQTLLRALRKKLPHNYRRQLEAKPRPVTFRTIQGALTGDVTDPVKILLVKKTLEKMIAENQRIKDRIKARKTTSKKSAVN